jgi:hypothetical protein
MLDGNKVVRLTVMILQRLRLAPIIASECAGNTVLCDRHNRVASARAAAGPSGRLLFGRG